MPVKAAGGLRGAAGSANLEWESVTGFLPEEKTECDAGAMRGVVTSTGDVGRPNVGSIGVLSFTGHVYMMQSVYFVDLETHVEAVGTCTVSRAGAPATGV